MMAAVFSFSLATMCATVKCLDQEPSLLKLLTFTYVLNKYKKMLMGNPIK